MVVEISQISQIVSSCNSWLSFHEKIPITEGIPIIKSELTRADCMAYTIMAYKVTAYLVMGWCHRRRERLIRLSRRDRSQVLGAPINRDRSQGLGAPVAHGT